jgi:hypothetical protein
MATEEYSVGYDSGYEDGWNAAIEQAQKQEPVAFIDNRIHGFPDCFVNYSEPPHTSPVYTSPPQRQPLSFDEVEDCFPDGGSSNEYGEVVVSPQWLHDFAAAVQRAAHGITGEQK